EDALREVLGGARRAEVDVEDVGARRGIAVAEIRRLLERGEAADARAVAEVLLVPGSRALDERRALDGPAVRGTKELAGRGAVRRGEPLHHDIGDDVRVPAEAEIVDAGGVIGIPARGDDHGAGPDAQRPR